MDRGSSIVSDPEPANLTAEEAIAANREQRGDRRKIRNASIKEFLRDILITAGAPVLQKILVERGAFNYSLDQLKRARRPSGPSLSSSAAKIRFTLALGDAGICAGKLRHRRNHNWRRVKCAPA